jgi:INO80 complex subunit C
MTFTRLRRKCIDEESSSNNVEENVEEILENVEEPSGENAPSEGNEDVEENETLGTQSEEISSSSEDVKKVKRSKPKIKPVIKKKVIDQENLHVENLTVKKYSTYKLGNFKNRSMKVFTKDMDIYNMKYMEISVRYSERPKKKICEFTGLPAMFTFPNSRLYYFDSSVYKHLKVLSSDLITFIYKTKEMCKNYNPFKHQY